MDAPGRCRSLAPGDSSRPTASASTRPAASVRSARCRPSASSTRCTYRIDHGVWGGASERERRRILRRRRIETPVTIPLTSSSEPASSSTPVRRLGRPGTARRFGAQPQPKGPSTKSTTDSGGAPVAGASRSTMRVEHVARARRTRRCTRCRCAPTPRRRRSARGTSRGARCPRAASRARRRAARPSRGRRAARTPTPVNTPSL